MSSHSSLGSTMNRCFFGKRVARGTGFWLTPFQDSTDVSRVRMWRVLAVAQPYH